MEAKPNLNGRLQNAKQKTRDKEDAEALAEGTRKLVNQSWTGDPSEITSKKANF